LIFKAFENWVAKIKKSDIFHQNFNKF
jgi:hypothetical protein